MQFLVKIEDFINRAILAAWGAVVGVLKKLCPAWLARAWSYPARGFAWVKALPSRAKASFLSWKNAPKELLKVDYKGLLAQAMEAGKKAYSAHDGKSPVRALLSAVAAPFAFLYRWAAELSPAQFTLLAVFTIGSLFAGLGITVNSRRILDRVHASRAPASVDDGIDPYDRPSYYKKNTRESTYNNVKIPVYVQGAGELRALIVDFSSISSNRATKKWIDRYEFEVRDHLVMHLEPVLPSFPLTDEGRTVLTDKIRDELNEFLRQNAVEGEVEEVRLIYVLGH